MSFTNSYRLERIYFEKLKDMINKLQPYLNEETDEKLKAILENSIDDNDAILLLYRNLGEAWAELSDLIKKADEKIDQTKEEAEKYHDELNERIDEVNNYIMGLIRIMEETKQDKLTAGDNITIDENNVISSAGGFYEVELRYNVESGYYDLYHDNILCNAYDLESHFDANDAVFYENDSEDNALRYYYNKLSLKKEENYIDEENYAKFYNLEIYNERDIGQQFNNVLYKSFVIELGVGVRNGEPVSMLQGKISRLTPNHYISIFANSDAMTGSVSDGSFGLNFYPTPDFAIQNWEENGMKGLRIENIDVSKKGIFILEAFNTSYSVDGNLKNGVVIKFTDFSFTNGNLNTRSLFVYENGIAEYTGV